MLEWMEYVDWRVFVASKNNSGNVETLENQPEHIALRIDFRFSVGKAPPCLAVGVMRTDNPTGFHGIVYRDLLVPIIVTQAPQRVPEPTAFPSYYFRSNHPDTTILDRCLLCFSIFTELLWLLLGS